MINKEIRLRGSKDSHLIFYVGNIQEHEEMYKGCAITINEEEDFVLNTEELDELIDYLDEMRGFIKEYNARN